MKMETTPPPHHQEPHDRRPRGKLPSAPAVVFKIPELVELILLQIEHGRGRVGRPLCPRPSCLWRRHRIPEEGGLRRLHVLQCVSTVFRDVIRHSPALRRVTLLPPPGGSGQAAATAAAGCRSPVTLNPLVFALLIPLAVEIACTTVPPGRRGSVVVSDHRWYCPHGFATGDRPRAVMAAAPLELGAKGSWRETALVVGGGDVSLDVSMAFFGFGGWRVTFHGGSTLGDLADALGEVREDWGGDEAVVGLERRFKLNLYSMMARTRRRERQKLLEKAARAR